MIIVISHILVEIMDMHFFLGMTIHFFPGNDDNLPFSKMIEFSFTTNYDDNSLFISRISVAPNC
jgi:hypothetical protein